MSNTAWYKAHFKNHPWKAHTDTQKRAEAYFAKGQSQKPKVYCSACLDRHFSEVLANDQTKMIQGEIKLEQKLGELTISANLPLSWVDNPQFLSFMDCFILQAKAVTRRSLNGSSVTLQADGWTGINHCHIIAFMLGINGKVYTVDIIDVTNEHKTADHFLKQLQDAYENAEKEMGVHIICIMTDASGEAAKARCMFKNIYPHVIVLDCYAHQANLIVGDYFRTSNDYLIQLTGQACELITWLRSKTILLGLIQTAYADSHKGRTKSVLRAVLTRWTSHFLAFDRLLKLEGTLQLVILKDSMEKPDDRKIVIGTTEAKEKETKMIQLIKNTSFWIGLSRVIHHLRPLAIATSTLQSTSCCLDTVLVTFGFLYMQFNVMKSKGDATQSDIDTCDRVLNSLEKRWGKADQAIFIAATILNPFYPYTIFNTHNLNAHFLSVAGAITLSKQLWKRFFRENAPQELSLEVIYT
ncbi:hypothetical protein FA15DRAFT_604826 [Coprinopsis marcescibilis]|uniref:Uncharacterized protein n=1 Tax=Coprinopsis marcescibilis TaxID=230819 RepID=A0A5C3KCI7_COPMA|nr:hypothetical protein FA15DRAFT_604826 [Coprinopsis marcescibilis]